ncbi:MULTISPECIES: SlyX family protein [unclassified Gilliamella]|uniref:SlyX family protein n=1 Tax=unclassified Gilliamella TaxID=2685620 RepID=UPI001C6A3285|nr:MULTISPECIES: SlyX family protein [unclassified Gilliamella]MCX8584391.1 SlyX family protein [Gilliamella sp. B3372]MCX8595226.1 SlyX family protein [Gilliamella sp. B3367]MCX8597912.1 SlyX family protein [Gilliamella sp. B3493]MCX8599523.1 SlyX family protein [Gilliamella sp. B3486]MCX8670798.1 SlyX family protein [Gilliamella sp. B2785]
MNQQLELLETKVAFQEMTIEELNQMVVNLQADISKLKEQLTLLSQKLQANQTSNIASLSEETPPPHY